jgi:antitoxin (DNA-binding transcriptional repressor) of toxin-antitoxin stability system
MYITAYNNSGMTVTIPEFRNNLFKLVERVIAGESVEFTHHGTTIRLVVPEGHSSKVDRLTPRRITNPKFKEKEHRAAERKLRAEMWAQIEGDWAEI